MKFLPSQLAYVFEDSEAKQNLAALLRFVALLLATIVIFAMIFHAIMVYEGQSHSWVTGFYWTLTVMSTLGFGDITFHTDLGRVFSILVLMTGIVMLLIVLPFVFIQMRAPCSLANSTILTILGCIMGSPPPVQRSQAP